MLEPRRRGIVLPEVILLYDARGERPENAVGVGEFWYEPEIWALPLSPAARVLYAGLCSFLGHGQINRKDLRGILQDHPEEAIAGALADLVRHNILEPNLDGYVVRSVRPSKAKANVIEASASPSGVPFPREGPGACTGLRPTSCPRHR